MAIFEKEYDEKKVGYMNNPVTYVSIETSDIDDIAVGLERCDGDVYPFPLVPLNYNFYFNTVDDLGDEVEIEISTNDLYKRVGSCECGEKAVSFIFECTLENDKFLCKKCAEKYSETLI
jgi:hypothetical protein